MATVRLICPHCARVDRLSIAKPVHFRARAARGAWLREAQLGQFGYDAVAPLNCHLCGGWSVGVFSVNGNDGMELLNSGVDGARSIEGSGQVELLEVFPETPEISVHETVPEAAKTFFVEAKEDLRSGRSPAGVISKCRSVLDLSLKELQANGAGRKARIADLRTRGLLTEALATWADRLWDDGNDAIHDLTGDASRALQHVRFLELFFEVAFALPAQVQDAQNHRAPEQVV